jgi:hypothetical protein
VLTNLANADPDRFVDDVARTLDPRLAQIEPSTAIPDSEPLIAARVRALLAAASAGKLTAQDLSFAQGEAAEQAKEFEELVHPLGALTRLDLLDRRVLGDDRSSTYAAVYADRTLRVQIALAPDDGIADFTIESE